MMMRSLRAPGSRLPQQHATRSAAAQAPCRMARLSGLQGRMRVVSLAEAKQGTSAEAIDDVACTKLQSMMEKFHAFDSDG